MAAQTLGKEIDFTFIRQNVPSSTRYSTGTLFDSLINVLTPLIPPDFIGAFPQTYTSDSRLYDVEIMKVTATIKNNGCKDVGGVSARLIIMNAWREQRIAAHKSFVEIFSKLRNNEEVFKDERDPPVVIEYNITPTFVSLSIVYRAPKMHAQTRSYVFTFSMNQLNQKLSD